MLAVQGPEALPRLEVEVAPFTFRESRVLGIDCVVRDRLHWERGCELMCVPEDAAALWNRILERGVARVGWGLETLSGWRPATRFTARI